MNAWIAAFAFAAIGVFNIPVLMTWGRKWYNAGELKMINNAKYKHIKTAYWGFAALLVPAMLGILFGGEFVMAKLGVNPSTAYVLPTFYAIALVPLYKAVFALFYGVLPVSQWDHFIYSAIDGEIRLLAQQIVVVVAICLAVFVFFSFRSFLINLW